MKTTHRKKIIALITIIAVMIATFPTMAFAASVAVAAPTTVTTSRTAYNKIQVKWNKVSGADGYAVYKATSKTGKYTLIKRIDSSKTTSYTWAKANVGTTYYFKVKAYKKVNGKRVYGSYSKVVSGKTYLAKPTVYRTDMDLGDYAHLYFSKVSGATGYEVWRSTKPDSGYTKVSTVSSKNSYYGYYSRAKKNVYHWAISGKNYKSETVYYHKVRAYRVVNGKKVYSNFSDYDITYEGVSSKQPWTQMTYLEEEGKKVFELVNAERKKQGYEELEWDEELYEYAKVRVQNCCQVYYRDGDLSHNAVGDYATGLSELGIENGASENAARGYYTGKDLFNGWMSSPGHKALFYNYHDEDFPFIAGACAVGIDKTGEVFGIFIAKDELFTTNFQYFK